ncbi:MAG: hypothetical protein ACE5PO_04660 [Candidatus Bathyarchaeia archaeon]
MGVYDKYVVTNPAILPGEMVPLHFKGAGPYHEFVNKQLTPEANLYMCLWKMERIPPANPTCKIHSHDVDQFVMYIGEPGTFEILYNLVPPDVELTDEFMAPKEHQYTINKTGCFYIPAGVKHNIKVLRLDKPPVYEVTVMQKSTYP